ncbi:O-GlcNAc transferase [Geobacter sp. AOG1]|nr:O-GlcNAc transferase [Geobacter sp. AOG1]
MNRSVRTNVAFCSFLCVLTVAVFWGVLGNDFLNYDDFQYVTSNRHVTSGVSIENVIWAFTSGYAANWHPVTWLSHMVDVELFDMNPQGHHLMNLLLHTANACLLFLLLNKITGSAWRSMVVASLFAIHPLHVESVAWVAERKDVLSTCFALLTLLAYASYVQRNGTWRYLALCGCFSLGLMSKPMLVTLPFVLLLLDYWPLRRFVPWSSETVDERSCRAGSKLPLSRLVMEKLPLFALALLSSCITIFVQKGALHPLDVTPLSFRIGNAVTAYLRYLGKTVWPSDLAVLYPLPPSIPILHSVSSAILLLLTSYGASALSRRRPYILVGWLWFLGTLVPVIGIVQVGLQSMADRYTYFPLIGIFIAVVWGVADLAGDRPAWRIPLALATAGALTAYSAVSWSYERCWKNSNTLFSHAIAVTSDNYYAHYMLGKALYDENMLQDALVHYSRAQQLNPRFADAYVNRGIIYSKQGKPKDAINDFSTALSINPGSQYAHYNIAVALQAQGRVEEAMMHYGEVLRREPDNAGAHYNLGNALMGLKRWDEALRHFSEVVRLKPESETARQNLEMCLKQKANQ